MAINKQRQAAVSDPTDNAILAALPKPSRDRLTAAAQFVEMAFKATLYESGEPVEYVWFPTSGVFSMLAQTGRNQREAVEVATVGKEGMVGLPVFLESDASP